MGKSWDTKKVNNFIECFEHVAHNYIERLSDVHRSYEEYTNNETFVGRLIVQKIFLISSRKNLIVSSTSFQKK